MTSPWFHHTPLPGVGEVVALSPDEAKHATGARRRTAGDTVTLFAGDGRTATGRIVEQPHGRRGCAIVIDDIVHHDPITPVVHLVTAVPKGDRASTMVSMLTQLGVSSIQPLISERAVVSPSANTVARWERMTIEACKQARRPWLPELRPAVRIDDFAAALSMSDGSMRALVAQPGGEAAATMVRLAAAMPRVCIVGPEGGLTDDEMHALTAAGALPIDLGRHILRIETAAIAMTVLATACDG